MHSILQSVGIRTVLLLHFDGDDGSTSFNDATGRHVVIPWGNAQLDTSQSKFGGASAFFDNGLLGTGTFLQVIGNTDDFVFGTGDFSVDFWGMIRATNHVGYGWDLRTDPADNAPALGQAVPGGAHAFYSIAGDTKIPGTIVRAANVWNHYAVARAGGITRLFIDGVQDGSYYQASDDLILGGFGIGARTLSAWSFSWDGWIDEFRVVKGAALWTSNFTPPTSPAS